MIKQYYKGKKSTIYGSCLLLTIKWLCVYSIYEENQRSGNWNYDISYLRFIDDTKKMFCNKNHARSILLLALLCEYVIPSLLIRFDVNG